MDPSTVHHVFASAYTFGAPEELMGLFESTEYGRDATCVYTQDHLFIITCSHHDKKASFTAFEKLMASYIKSETSKDQDVFDIPKVQRVAETEIDQDLDDYLRRVVPAVPETNIQDTYDVSRHGISPDPLIQHETVRTIWSAESTSEFGCFSLALLVQVGKLTETQIIPTDQPGKLEIRAERAENAEKAKAKLNIIAQTHDTRISTRLDFDFYIDEAETDYGLQLALPKDAEGRRSKTTLMDPSSYHADTWETCLILIMWKWNNDSQEYNSLHSKPQQILPLGSECKLWDGHAYGPVADTPDNRAIWKSASITPSIASGKQLAIMPPVKDLRSRLNEWVEQSGNAASNAFAADNVVPIADKDEIGSAPKPTQPAAAAVSRVPTYQKITRVAKGDRDKVSKPEPALLPSLVKNQAADANLSESSPKMPLSNQELLAGLFSNDGPVPVEGSGAHNEPSPVGNLRVENPKIEPPDIQPPHMPSAADSDVGEPSKKREATIPAGRRAKPEWAKKPVTDQRSKPLLHSSPSTSTQLTRQIRPFPSGQQQNPSQHSVVPTQAYTPPHLRTPKSMPSRAMPNSTPRKQPSDYNTIKLAQWSNLQPNLASDPLSSTAPRTALPTTPWSNAEQVIKEADRKNDIFMARETQAAKASISPQNQWVKITSKNHQSAKCAHENGSPHVKRTVETWVGESTIPAKTLTVNPHQRRSTSFSRDEASKASEVPVNTAEKEDQSELKDMAEVVHTRRFTKPSETGTPLWTDPSDESDPIETNDTSMEKERDVRKDKSPVLKSISRLHKPAPVLITEDGHISLLLEMLNASEMMLECARSIPGQLQIKVDLGRILVENTMDVSNFRRYIMPKSDWSSTFHTKSGTGQAKTSFTRMLTTSWADAEFMLGLKLKSGRRLFIDEPQLRRATFELHCRTKQGDLVRIDVHGEEGVKVQNPVTTIGTINWHFPKRLWDARLVLDETSNVDVSHNAAISDIIKNLYIPSGETLPKVYTKTASSEVEITSIIFRRETMHLCTTTQNIVLKLTECQDLVVQTSKKNAFAERHFRACALPAETMVRDGNRLWWEASLSSIIADQILREHQTMEPGETASWSTKSFAKHAIIRDLFTVTQEVVTRIDAVGWGNRAAPTTAPKAIKPKAKASTKPKEESKKAEIEYW